MKFQIKDLTVRKDDNILLDKLSLSIEMGETIAILGRNGSGKSTLAQTIMGNPEYVVDSGDILLDNKNLLEMEVNVRAVAGIYLAFQYPIEIPGLNFSEFLRLAYNTKFSDAKLSVFKFRQLLKEKCDILNIKHEFIDRNLNEGLSGGEKKKMEVLQLFVLQPNIVILDEIDSGLDKQAQVIVFEALQKYKQDYKDTIFILITHYDNIFEYLKVDRTFEMKDKNLTLLTK